MARPLKHQYSICLSDISSIVKIGVEGLFQPKTKSRYISPQIRSKVWPFGLSGRNGKIVTPSNLNRFSSVNYHSKALFTLKSAVQFSFSVAAKFWTRSDNNVPITLARFENVIVVLSSMSWIRKCIWLCHLRPLVVVLQSFKDRYSMRFFTALRLLNDVMF